MIELSKEKKAEDERMRYYNRQKIMKLRHEIRLEAESKQEELKRKGEELSKRQDVVEEDSEPVEPKTKNFAETAIMALTLGQKVLDLYKTVSPYIN